MRKVYLVTSSDGDLMVDSRYASIRRVSARSFYVGFVVKRSYWTFDVFTQALRVADTQQSETSQSHFHIIKSTATAQSCNHAERSRNSRREGSLNGEVGACVCRGRLVKMKLCGPFRLPARLQAGKRVTSPNCAFFHCSGVGSFFLVTSLGMSGHRDFVH